MSNHIQVTFCDLQPEQQELLIAHLTEIGFEGFEENERELKAFIPEASLDRSLLNEIIFKYQLQYSEEKIAAQNWNTLWESNFDPVIIDDFLVIRAGFHETVSGVGHEIVVTPKMSFGTGHHATTYLMVQQMRQMDFTGKKVFDFGTGTGVLAILAEKLDSAEVVAIDNDDWSIANAAENFERNNCYRIKLGKAASLQDQGQYDIILANINKNVILENLSSLSDHLNKGGILLLSGLLAEDGEDILQKAGEYSLTLINKSEKNNWICLRFNG